MHEARLASRLTIRWINLNLPVKNRIFQNLCTSTWYLRELEGKMLQISHSYNITLHEIRKQWLFLINFTTTSTFYSLSLTLNFVENNFSNIFSHILIGLTKSHRANKVLFEFWAFGVFLFVYLCTFNIWSSTAIVHSN